MVVNGVGVVDSDYVEESFVLLYNTSDGPITIRHGDRIAQAEVICNVPIQFTIIPHKPEKHSERSGGFGSTGV